MEIPCIKIFTRSMNPALYDRAMFFMDLPYPKVRLTQTTADGYFYKMLEDVDADIAINIDEDAFVFNLDALKQLIEFVIGNDYVNCGMRDGGVVDMRPYSPVVTNPYFNILNLKLIREYFSEPEIRKIKEHSNFDSKTYSGSLLKMPYEICMAEPYYPFFLWLSMNFKTLYLDAEEHSDNYSTTLKNHLGEPFLIHTWFSRHYYFDCFHTKRIDAVIHFCELKTDKEFSDSLSKKLRNMGWVIFTFLNIQRRKIRRWIYLKK